MKNAALGMFYVLSCQLEAVKQLRFGVFQHPEHVKRVSIVLKKYVTVGPTDRKF